MSTFKPHIVRQGKVWITRDGRKFFVEEMEPEHRANLLAWLRRRARTLHFCVAGLSVSGMPNVDTAAYDMVSDALDREIDMDPEKWLEEQPLVRRLVELEDRP